MKKKNQKNKQFYKAEKALPFGSSNMYNQIFINIRMKWEIELLLSIPEEIECIKNTFFLRNNKKKILIKNTIYNGHILLKNMKSISLI